MNQNVKYMKMNEKYTWNNENYTGNNKITPEKMKLRYFDLSKLYKLQN